MVKQRNSVRDKKTIIEELQLVTGVVSDDYDYLLYLLLEEGTFFSKSEEDIFVQPEHVVKQEVVQDLDIWFKSIGG